jgi:hypothetical protein
VTTRRTSTKHPHGPFYSPTVPCMRMSCSYTSPQNGKDGHIIRTINNVIRLLLSLVSTFHASMLLGRGPSHCHILAQPSSHEDNQRLLSLCPLVRLATVLRAPLCVRLRLIPQCICHTPKQVVLHFYLVCLSQILIRSQGIPVPLIFPPTALLSSKEGCMSSP